MTAGGNKVKAAAAPPLITGCAAHFDILKLFSISESR
jgi:hypothetical protein